ncbi:MAG TPA: hypothetical protein VJG83_01320 [archaeon]|nr:hypothetical protein [archaeon]
MVSMTLSIEDAMRKRMKKHPQIKWSEVARAAIRQQLEDIEKTQRIASRSRLTESQINEIALLVDKEMLRHFEDLGNKRTD